MQNTWELTKGLKKFILSVIEEQLIRKKIYNINHDTVKAAKPNIIGLELGINDLINGKPPSEVAKVIKNTAVELLKADSAEVIVIFGVLGSDRVTDQEGIRQCNNKLYYLCKSHPNIVFMHHRELRYENIKNWSKDGIHANTELGRHLYTKSIRRAVFIGVEKLWESRKERRLHKINKVYNTSVRYVIFYRYIAS